MIQNLVLILNADTTLSDATNLTSAIHLYSLQTNEYLETKKLIFKIELIYYKKLIAIFLIDLVVLFAAIAGTQQLNSGLRID